MNTVWVLLGLLAIFVAHLLDASSAYIQIYYSPYKLSVSASLLPIAVFFITLAIYLICRFTKLIYSVKTFLSSAIKNRGIYNRKALRDKYISNILAGKYVRDSKNSSQKIYKLLNIYSCLFINKHELGIMVLDYLKSYPKDDLALIMNCLFIVQDRVSNANLMALAPTSTSYSIQKHLYLELCLKNSSWELGVKTLNSQELSSNTFIKRCIDDFYYKMFKCGASNKEWVKIFSLLKIDYIFCVEILIMALENKQEDMVLGFLESQLTEHNANKDLMDIYLRSINHYSDNQLDLSIKYFYKIFSDKRSYLYLLYTAKLLMSSSDINKAIEYLELAISNKSYDIELVLLLTLAYDISNGGNNLLLRKYHRNIILGKYINI